jgi:hypothetical protein
MTTEMTITEGLKRLKLISKRMTKNCAEINKYASLLSNEKPFFESEDAQKREVASLIQANIDLEKEYCKIKAMVDYTNLITMVQIDDDSRSIHGWLNVVRKTGRHLIDTFNSLSTQSAMSRMARYMRDGDKSPHAVRLYDENEKRTGQRKWEDLTNGEIEGRLEVVNATTKLVEPPSV